jgi:hypothetical protein
VHPIHMSLIHAGWVCRGLAESEATQSEEVQAGHVHGGACRHGQSFLCATNSPSSDALPPPPSLAGTSTPARNVS